MNADLRKKTIDSIKKYIIDLPNNDINELYTSLTEAVEIPDTKENNTRQKKILCVINNLHFVDDDDLNKFNQLIQSSLNVVVDVESKEGKMKRVALEIINKILDLNNMKHINDLCDFVDIRRDILVDEKCAELLNENKKYIFDNGFNKQECKNYQTNLKHSQLSLLKGMLKQIGYNLCSKNHKKMVNYVSQNFTSYTIKEKE